MFDSIIGNEDRHQENWSIVVTNRLVEKSTLFRRKGVVTETSYSFAPIYDSGSSMGHELTDTKVSQMLNLKPMSNAESLRFIGQMKGANRNTLT